MGSGWEDGTGSGVGGDSTEVYGIPRDGKV